MFSFLATGFSVAKATQANSILMKLAIVGAFLLGALLATLGTVWFVNRQSNCCYGFGKARPALVDAYAGSSPQRKLVNPTASQ